MTRGAGVQLAPLALALAAALAPQERATDWARVWGSLRAAEAAAPGSAERAAAVGELRREGQAVPAGWRARVLAFHLARLAGEEAAPVAGPEPPETLALVAGEAWIAARALEPGPAGERALFAALREVGAQDEQACLVLAFERFQALMDAFRLERALPLAEAMFARRPAGWSAVNLARALTRAGRHVEARAVLTAQIERDSDPASLVALHDERALAALGAGDERAGERDLGYAWARGSPNAGVVLGQRALTAGLRERARAIFRTLLDAEPPEAWALRGWGLSMVRPPRSGAGDPHPSPLTPDPVTPLRGGS